MKSRRSGNAVLEFTLVGVPMIFVLISVLEIGRLTWSYHTLTSAVTEGARYAIVHGKNCNQSPNACAVSIGDIASRVKSRGVGLVPTDTQLKLVALNSTTTCRLDECASYLAPWPAPPANEPGMEIEVAATYSVHSMISMFWPGAGSVAPFGLLQLTASSREAIQF